jgi:hypothetical protein
VAADARERAAAEARAAEGEAARAAEQLGAARALCDELQSKVSFFEKRGAEQAKRISLLEAGARKREARAAEVEQRAVEAAELRQVEAEARAEDAARAAARNAVRRQKLVAVAADAQKRLDAAERRGQELKVLLAAARRDEMCAVQKADVAERQLEAIAKASSDGVGGGAEAVLREARRLLKEARMQDERTVRAETALRPLQMHMQLYKGRMEEKVRRLEDNIERLRKHRG